MLPLTLLRSAQGLEILVELKNGETYNGHLVNIDAWMNLNLRDVKRTSSDGARFWAVPELYVRGNTVKYLRVPDKVVDIAAESARSGQGRSRGGRGRARRDGRSAYGSHSRYDSD